MSSDARFPAVVSDPLLSAAPAILRPFDIREALTLYEAAAIAGRSAETVRLWSVRHGLGRRVAGRWTVSRIALAMWLDGDGEALAAYHRGDRGSLTVKPYIDRAGMLPCL